MRIAIFTDAYIDSAGGIPVTIDSQRKYLETQGHIVTVFCPARYANRYGFAIVDENLHSTRKGEADRRAFTQPARHPHSPSMVLDYLFHYGQIYSLHPSAGYKRRQVPLTPQGKQAS